MNFTSRRCSSFFSCQELLGKGELKPFEKGSLLLCLYSFELLLLHLMIRHYSFAVVNVSVTISTLFAISVLSVILLQDVYSHKTVKHCVVTLEHTWLIFLLDLKKTIVFFQS